MKFLIKYSILIFSSTFLFSCSEDTINNNITTPVDTAGAKNFKYPFKQNSFWYYTTRNFVTNLRPDSLSVYFSADTIDGLGGATFTKDTVINLDTLKLLRNSHSSEGHSHTTLEFYKQSDTGLIRIAVYSDGLNFGPYRSSVNLNFTFHGQTFGSLNELTSNLKYDKPSGDTTLYYDDPPIKVLKYPLTENTEWGIINYGTTKITKKYTDFENISVPAGNFYCIKVQRNVYYNSAIPDTNYFYYDYFSKYGMIKRDFLLKDILVSNNNGDPIGYIDVKEEDFINFYILP
ncbi:MAG TPA: hypothetical protein PKC91_03525 [Ignavibacteria bacterium]|mgnify:CR=1 FL=1|nr:hypothetical protein [Ignavibacteria bacterium]